MQFSEVTDLKDSRKLNFLLGDKMKTNFKNTVFTVITVSGNCNIGNSRTRVKVADKTEG